MDQNHGTSPFVAEENPVQSLLGSNCSNIHQVLLDKRLNVKKTLLIFLMQDASLIRLNFILS